MKTLALVFFSMFFSACGTEPKYYPEHKQDTFVLRARTTFFVTTNPDGTLQLLSSTNPANQPVTVVVSPDVQLTISSANFSVPTMTSDTLSFGTLDVTNIRDNNTKVCGTGGNTKCTKAVLRVYTTGTAGPGFWNTTSGYGAPLIAGAVTSGITGLGTANSVVVQTYVIPASKYVVHTNDFSPAPKIVITGDFSNAGAGSYSTTVVVEYGLSL